MGMSPVNSGVALAEPDASPESYPMRAFVSTEYRETFVEIYALHPERRLVTCVEVLSPSNKRPNTLGWEQYARKRQALLLGAANLVEIDLLRGGQRMPMLDPWRESPYTILVARRYLAPSCRVWPAYFHRPLPMIPVPLAKPDPDLSLDLQPLIDAIYSLAHYDEDIDYAKPLVPPLTAEDSAWLATRLHVKN